jgi:endoglycosylceramidase
MSKGNRRVALGVIGSLAFLLSACGNDGELVAAAPLLASRHAQFVTDSGGGALILHGINVSGSAKDDPLRMPWVSRADAERVQRDWGFNVVRFLIFWDALEPAPGQYDEAYLDRVAERIAWFAAVGVYVILDMHQDVYGHFDESGAALGFDGAPPWAARTDGLAHRIVNPWSLTYIQPGVKRAFDNFWNASGPHADVQQHYIAAWTHVAERFKDEEFVLGYNLMNEPFAGSALAGDFGGFPVGDPARSKAFEETLFRSFYQRAIDAIRAVDSDGWIFYEPLAFPVNNGGASHIGKLVDPRAGEDRLVYFPHLYAIVPELNQHYDPQQSPELDSWIEERGRDLRELQEPMMIGEFGLPWDAGGNPLGYLEKILNMADEMTGGWAYWAYDPGNWAPVAGADLHETPNVDVLVRVYPQRVAGKPIEYGYDPQSRVFELSFVDVNGVSGATQIYIPERRFYASGWRLDIADTAGSWTSQWDATRQVLSVTTARSGGLHHLRIVPAP